MPREYPDARITGDVSLAQAAAAGLGSCRGARVGRAARASPFTRPCRFREYPMRYVNRSERVGVLAADTAARDRTSAPIAG